MRGKNGSLSLSVNAIVVLILAIVLLAFGLSFITKLLSKGEQSLTGLFPESKLEPTSTKPIGLASDLLVRPGESVRLTIQILNPTATAITAELAFPGGNPAGCPNTIRTEQVTIPAGEIQTVRAVITGHSLMIHNEICKIQFGGVQQSFFLSTKGSI